MCEKGDNLEVRGQGTHHSRADRSVGWPPVERVSARKDLSRPERGSEEDGVDFCREGGRGWQPVAGEETPPSLERLAEQRERDGGGVWERGARVKRLLTLTSHWSRP